MTTTRRRGPHVWVCRSVWVCQLALAGCVLPPDRHARLADAGADARLGGAADSTRPGEDVRGPPGFDARLNDALPADDRGSASDAVPKVDAGRTADARSSIDLGTRDAGPPAGFRVDGRLVLGAGASSGDTHRVVGRLATGETRAFGMNYGIEGGLRISCNQETTCIDTAE